MLLCQQIIPLVHKPLFGLDMDHDIIAEKVEEFIQTLAAASSHSAYQRLIRESGLQCSMSAKGRCYDNACAESFFHSLKVEAIHGERFVTREEMRQTVFEYIEVDYNRTRRHSANGFISPAAFEANQGA